MSNFSVILEVRGKSKFVQAAKEGDHYGLVLFDKEIAGDFIKFEQTNLKNLDGDKIEVIANKFYNYKRNLVDGQRNEIEINDKKLLAKLKKDGKAIINFPGLVYVSPANRKRLYKGVPANKAKDKYSIVEARLVVKSNVKDLDRNRRQKYNSAGENIEHLYAYVH